MDCYIIFFFLFIFKLHIIRFISLKLSTDCQFFLQITIFA